MKYFSKNKYHLLVNAIGITVAFTMNFSELIALFSPEEANTVYPGLDWTQVGSEVLFTYLSIIILFWLNRIIFRFNGESIELSTKLFFRANRQFLISRKAIKDISLWFNGRLVINLNIPFELKEKIIISKAKASEFKEWF